ncbi:hypothetical protein ABTW72_12165 [Micromonospora sp. NPDC127501]|uniref:hypothetical protein n=1 Tax=Micromonospora sp. NPDC127501 TaxID=3154872 RepID=UPI00331B099F
MLIDARWVALIAACLAILLIVRKRKEWAEPLLVMAAIATLLITLFFFVGAPIVRLA